MESYMFLFIFLFKFSCIGSGNRATLFNVVGEPLRFPQSPVVSFSDRDLIRGVLVKEPQQRLAYKRGATEIKQHPFFEGVNWALIRCASPLEIPKPVEIERIPARTSSADVERFIVYISVSQDDVTLYVVEPRSSEVRSVAGSNQLSFSTPVYGAQNLMVPPQFHHQANFVSPHFQYQTQSQNPQPFPNPNPNQLSAPNSGFRINQLDDDEPIEKIVSTSRYSKFDLGQYPNFDLGQYSDFDDVSEEETDPTCNDFDIGQYPNFVDETAAVEEDVVDDNEEEITTVNEHVEHPFCNSYNPEEEEIPEENATGKDDCFDTKEDLKIALVYRGHEIMTDMNARFKISISYSQAWRAKCYALELLRGSPEASFAQLSAYCHNLKLKNPGSVTHIKTDRDGRFELLFIAIGVADCIGPISNLTIISDRANSIDNAVRRCFSDAFHGLCGVQLYRNLKSRRVLPQCAQTLEDVGFEIWSRVHQLGVRYGFMTSNSAESINALSRYSRKLPITMLMEFFRASIQQWYYKKRNHAVALHLNQDDSSAYAMDCYTTEVYRQTYAEIIYPIPHPSEWDIPDDLQTVLPPAMDRRLPGRLKVTIVYRLRVKRRRDRHVVGARKVVIQG
ncbi:hypothetical protein F3Y22_tig00001120pilonHSYRG00136 [Hibiscus syriacus]|uniref:non-specific serine/threonine protein kinase n=1 Tax=Hibiscus syriacus TaxID=106335 RepID=A0A6A3D191_HIBSY|nr:hypothetical protein F3Y22_tig00001120pilonHSYRG00136 [Hibiscus syriacus]